MTYERVPRRRGWSRHRRATWGPSSGLGALAPAGVSILSRQAVAYRAQPEVLAANLAEAQAKGWTVSTDSSGRIHVQRPKTALDRFGLPVIAAATALAIPGVAPAIAAGARRIFKPSPAKPATPSGSGTLPPYVFDPVTGMPIATSTPGSSSVSLPSFNVSMPSAGGGGGGGAPPSMPVDEGAEPTTPGTPGGISPLMLIGGGLLAFYLVPKLLGRRG